MGRFNKRFEGIGGAGGTVDWMAGTGEGSGIELEDQEEEEELVRFILILTHVLNHFPLRMKNSYFQYTFKEVPKF
ncbi:hypothetical protein LENED_002378 [Lentinula edodes]|uniref:Uncharacterized protein n=1 Tax=Lentinula edodes TaxID=5353 RepID=A0A1Q3E0X1_LENED|nr:hypothetical protein LENED_002378 [Lentinula edodes]